jgi:Kdo2-lipid IVA lauroyltransferase/acyltransferase
MLRLGAALLWLIHFLPFSVISAIGRGLGTLAYYLGQARVARINIDACFPQLSAQERKRMLKTHFAYVGESLLCLGLLWWAPAERIARLVQIEGAENYVPYRGKKPVIGFAPHFVGVEMGTIRLALDYEAAAIYSRQKDPYLNELLLKSRTRFKPITMIARQDGLRGALRALRQGLTLYVLPDMDMGREDSVFVPFFGIPAATVPVLSRLAAISGAVVIPAVTRRRPDGQGYIVKIYEAWENFPTADPVADTRRMNEFLEARVHEMPEQYFWVHKRFRTRPDGVSAKTFYP